MNRLNEIRLNSTPEQWHYVPASQNLEDFSTRFIPFSKLKFHQSSLDSPNLLEQQINSISANIFQTKGQYQSFIKWDHYSSLKKFVLDIARLSKFNNYG